MNGFGIEGLTNEVVSHYSGLFARRVRESTRKAIKQAILEMRIRIIQERIKRGEKVSCKQRKQLQEVTNLAAEGSKFKTAKGVSKEKEKVDKLIFDKTRELLEKNRNFLYIKTKNKSYNKEEQRKIELDIQKEIEEEVKVQLREQVVLQLKRRIVRKHDKVLT